MALVAKSLDMVSATGPGVPLTFDVPKTQFAMQAIISGSPSDAEISLEYSIDGVTFYPLTNASFTDGQIVSVSDHVAVAVRANLTLLSGGTSPAVTVWIAAA